MDSVERSEVDISQIFNWGRVYEIIGTQLGEDGNPMVEAVVYMKLLGDADLGRARVYALRKSSELRRKLKDTNSDERLAYIRDIDEMQKDDILNMIILFSGRQLSIEARKNIKVQEPKAPKSTASLEKMEKFQKEVDDYPARRLKAISDEMDKQIAKLKKELNEQSKEELYKKYVNTLIDEFCERESMEAFKTMQVYLGCFEDSTYKKLFFSSFDEFDNLEPNAKQNFKDAYERIDIDISELKKLRLATQ